MPKRPKEAQQPEKEPEKPGRLGQQKGSGRVRRHGALPYDEFVKGLEDAGMLPKEPPREDLEALVPTATSLYDYVDQDRAGVRPHELQQRITRKEFRKSNPEDRAKLLVALQSGLRGDRPEYTVTYESIAVNKKEQEMFYVIRLANRVVPAGQERVVLAHLKSGGEGYALYTTQQGYQQIVEKGILAARRTNNPRRGR